MGIFNDNSQNDHLGHLKFSTEIGPPGPRGQRGLKGPKGQPGVGYKLTPDGNYNIDGKRLTNVGEPTGDGDATTKLILNLKTLKKLIKLMLIQKFLKFIHLQIIIYNKVSLFIKIMVIKQN